MLNERVKKWLESEIDPELEDIDLFIDKEKAPDEAGAKVKHKKSGVKTLD